MPVNNAIGVSIGLAPPELGPTAVRVPMDFTASLSQRYDALSGQGSASAKYGYQTAFIDNSQNAGSLTVVCDGTLLAYSVPPKSYAFLPIACPPGSLGITFTVANLGAVVAAQLLDVPTPYVVWSALALDAPTEAIAPSDANNLLGSATMSATVGAYTSIFSAADRKGAAISNPNNATIFVRESVNTPGAGSVPSYIIPPNTHFVLPVAPKRRYWARSDTASVQIGVTTW